MIFWRRDRGECVKKSLQWRVFSRRAGATCRGLGPTGPNPWVRILSNIIASMYSIDYLSENKKPSTHCVRIVFVWRRDRDSNPRKLSLQRFSRPPLSTAQPSLHNKIIYVSILRVVCVSGGPATFVRAGHGRSIT